MLQLKHCKDQTDRVFVSFLSFVFMSLRLFKKLFKLQQCVSCYLRKWVEKFLPVRVVLATLEHTVTTKREITTIAPMKMMDLKQLLTRHFAPRFCDQTEISVMLLILFSGVNVLPSAGKRLKNHT